MENSDKWSIKDLVKNCRKASHSTQEHLTEQLKMKMSQISNTKKGAYSVNNIENGRSLTDNGLYNSILNKFLFINVEHEIDIVKKAMEIANVLVEEKADLDIKKIFRCNLMLELVDYIDGITKKLKKSYVEDLITQFSWEISIHTYEFKRVDSNNLPNRFSMNESAKFAFNLAYYYLLGTYKYNEDTAFFSKEDSLDESFLGAAKAFGYHDWENMAEGQKKNNVLKNINIRMGLLNHIKKNPAVKDYIDSCGKLIENCESEMKEVLEKNERVKSIGNLIKAIEKETQTPEDAFITINFLNEIENILMEAFRFYQGYFYLPGPTYFEILKENIEDIECFLQDTDTTEDNRNDFKHTIEKIKRHYNELKQYFNENKDHELIADSLYSKAVLLANMIKRAKLEWIDLKRIYWYTHD